MLLPAKPAPVPYLFAPWGVALSGAATSGALKGSEGGGATSWKGRRLAGSSVLDNRRRALSLDPRFFAP